MQIVTCICILGGWSEELFKVVITSTLTEILLTGKRFLNLLLLLMKKISPEQSTQICTVDFSRSLKDYFIIFQL